MKKFIIVTILLSISGTLINNINARGNILPPGSISGETVEREKKYQERIRKQQQESEARRKKIREGYAHGKK